MLDEASFHSGGDIEEGLAAVLQGDWSRTPMASRLAASDRPAADLIGSLLATDPTERPCTAGRTAALVQHPWFAARLGAELSDVVERRVRPPLIVRGGAGAPRPGTGAVGDFWVKI